MEYLFNLLINISNLIYWILNIFPDPIKWTIFILINMFSIYLLRYRAGNFIGYAIKTFLILLLLFLYLGFYNNEVIVNNLSLYTWFINIPDRFILYLNEHPILFIVSLIIIFIIVQEMFFNGKLVCDHEWYYHDSELVGVINKKVIRHHKCTKCGRIEQCNDDDEKPYLGGSHDGDPICSKCGS